MCAAPPAHGQAVFGVQDARVDIAVDSAAVAHVRSTYVLAERAALPFLQYLTAKCAAVGRVSVSLGGDALELPPAERGPWVDLTPDVADRRGSPGDTLVVSYSVRLSATVASIPLVIPAVPLAGAATITLRLPPGDARPVLPHLVRGAAGTWTAQFRALPSAIRVDLGSHGGQRPCAETRPAGDAGTFSIRLAVFIATLVLWIPLYFWWASRQSDPT